METHRRNWINVDANVNIVYQNNWKHYRKTKSVRNENAKRRAKNFAVLMYACWNGRVGCDCCSGEQVVDACFNEIGRLASCRSRLPDQLVGSRSLFATQRLLFVAFICVLTEIFFFVSFVGFLVSRCRSLILLLAPFGSPSALPSNLRSYDLVALSRGAQFSRREWHPMCSASRSHGLVYS